MATLYYRPYTSDPITDGDLPAEASSATPRGGGALVDYDYIFPAGPGAGTSRQPNRQQAAAPVSNGLVPKLHNYGPDYIAQLDGQLGEIEKYREALRKMGQDILALRDKIRELELENSGLRRDLGSYADASKILQDSVELDGIPRAELLARYAALRHNLSGSVAQLRQYKDKVHRLQNQLIRSNQSAVGLEQLSGAHESQQRLLQRLQERVGKQRKLEEACAKQEKVIERMERLLRDKRTSGGEDEAKARGLMEENRRLREEIAAAREGQRQKRNGMESSERLELYQLLDKAETRIASLEKQIDSTARKQRREKDRLMEDIGEAERAVANRRRRRDRRGDGGGGGGGGNQPNVQFFAVPVPFEVKGGGGGGGGGRNRARSTDESEDDY